MWNLKIKQFTVLKDFGVNDFARESSQVSNTQVLKTVALYNFLWPDNLPSPA